MDILNWIYMKTAGLVKTEANDAQTDLVALGAQVPFSKRDDGYQTYGMTLADAVHAGCTENNTLRTGIYDIYPFAIGVPVMTKTCTQVIDTPASPTFLAVNLQGWKISGSVNLDENLAQDLIYLGTVETNTFFTNFPWKITGTVYAADPVSLGYGLRYSALANGATVYDNNGNTFIPCDIIQFIPDPFTGGFDLYLAYEALAPGAEVSALVSFEYEFLTDITEEPTFTYY
jgi:hypothetical protein